MGLEYIKIFYKNVNIAMCTLPSLIVGGIFTDFAEKMTENGPF